MGLNGLILVGGENKRFDGLPKGALEWDGQSMFERVHGALSSVVEDVYISIHDERPPGIPEEIPAVTDYYTHVRGPMNGVYSGLEQLGEPLLVIPWDMPGINAMFLRHLADRYDPDAETMAWYVNTADQSHPFPGIYTPEATGPLKQSLEDGDWGMIHWLQTHPTETIPLPNQDPPSDADDPLMNVNEPDDLRDMFRGL